ncbi:MAG: hypothetical protein F4Y99_10535 [Acidimicrobiaceae bacterium]|nr:hypothetical protein [Acidimicrobiaceae bacterium]MYJ35086.1 hypothetical protein [Acidimicrobiaceae bacterium]
MSLAFGARVLAQAVQRWGPVSFLPPFDDFQGSGLSYPVLLGAQVFILAIIAVVLVRMHRGKGLISPRLILPVTLFSALYFVVMAVRLVLGLSVLSDSGWFSTWIPTVFHLVLASMLMLIAAYQHRAN